MVASILRYGSEVWWTQVVEARQLEAIQLGAMKGIMRVAKTRNREVEGLSRESGEDTLRVLSGNGVEGSGSG